MNKRLTALFVIVLIIIAAGIYLISQTEKAAPPVTVPVTETKPATVVEYYCAEGTIVGSFSDKSANLSLSDGRSIELAQVVSASGLRYENGAISFSTKGSNGFLMEGDKTTYNNCVSGMVTTSGDIRTFTDSNKFFTFSYPTTGTLSGSLGYDVNWRSGTDKLGLQLAQVTIPKTIQPKTNLSDSRFTVGTSSDPDAVKNCLTDNMGGKDAGILVTINGVQYTRLSSSDAGAGNLYDTTSYRVVRNGQCYAIEYTIHSTQLGNYPKSAGIKAYDKAAITATLDAMVQSFKFL